MPEGFIDQGDGTFRSEATGGIFTQGDIDAGFGRETPPSGGGGGGTTASGTVTAADVLAWFEAMGKDPGVHGDGSTEDPDVRTQRIADEINSGQRSAVDVQQAIRTLPDDPTAGFPSIEELRALFDEALAGAQPEPIDYRAAAANLFPNFPSELLDMFADEWAKFNDPDLALAAVRNSAIYDTLFPGIKRDDGTLRMTEGEYSATMEAYGRLFREFGLNANLFEGRFVELMEGTVSPSELAGRLGAAYEQIITNIPQVREFYAESFGLDLTDQAIFASFLDPDISDAILNRRLSVAQVGGEALARGFDIGDAFAGRLAAAGVDQGAARQFFADAEGRLPTLDELARRFSDPDPTFDIDELAAASIFGSADQGRRIRRLLASEQSLFTGQIGTVATSDEFTLTGLRAR